ncbi:MAG: transcriptional regulator [Spirochaetales bacterium]|nr:transcriptional regulator [Spirochaetales bacterium]
MNPFTKASANDNFSRALAREKMQKILNLPNPHRNSMLSLREVREILRPSSESYRGIQAVPVSRIVGSEGRYADFNKQFLPRHEYLRSRWTRIDEAHLTDIPLPAIRVYEIGGVYFVRDGNHRVSVARSQGGLSIDAEVVSLGSEITLDPGMTRNDLKSSVIEYEKRQFYQTTRFGRIFPEYDLVFTATGRYDEVLRHIYEHKYYINMNYQEEILFEDAMKSWYDNVFAPITRVVREQKLPGRFPGRTEADLYVWLVKHWDELKKSHGGEFSLSEAAEDFSGQFGKGLRKRIGEAIARRRAARAKQRRIARGELREGDLD